jgi:hypothetical protein
MLYFNVLTQQLQEPAQTNKKEDREQNNTYIEFIHMELSSAQY